MAIRKITAENIEEVNENKVYTFLHQVGNFEVLISIPNGRKSYYFWTSCNRVAGHADGKKYESIKAAIQYRRKNGDDVYECDSEEEFALLLLNRKA